MKAVAPARSSSSQLRPVLLAAALVAASLSPGAHAEPRVARPGHLSAGVAYAPAPFVAGSKVRTPESTDTLLVIDLAQRLGLQARIQSVDTSALARPLNDFRLDALIATLPARPVADEGVALISTGHAVRPMAILRTDTDIKTWEQLKGRTVCVAEGGPYAGTVGPQYGAIEMVYGAPADALLALRIGECDAAVHEDTLLQALLKFPEWKKFSASLPAGKPIEQYVVASSANTELLRALRQAVAEWKSQKYIKKLTAQMAHDIAFEVYLDQNVPDCH